MTYEFEYLIYLVFCAATNLSPSPPQKSMDYAKMLRLASEQSVLSLADYALKLAKFDIPDAYAKEAKTRLRNAVVRETIRKAEVLNVLESLSREGIRARVIKGYAVAEGYAVPECRISGDVDLLIDPRDESRSCEILRQSGFLVEPRAKGGHHDACEHPEIGPLELHVALFGEIAGMSFFHQVKPSDLLQEDDVLIHSVEGDYYTLGYTDHLLFLILHMVKHFLTSGTNLRMLMDIAVYYTANKEKINRGRLSEIVEKMRSASLLHTIYSVFIRYGGYSIGDFEISDAAPGDQVNAFLEDLEACGGMRFDDADRESGAAAIQRQRLIENTGKLSYLTFALKHFFRESFSAIFPKPKHLARQYPSIARYPFLLPFVWAHRLLYRGGRAVAGKKVTIPMGDAISEGGKKRVQLFQLLDMM